MDKAKLFMNGQSQAVRLPKAYRLEGSEVLIKKMGEAVVLLPEKGNWEPLISSLKEFTPDFLESRDQPDQPDRRSWD